MSSHIDLDTIVLEQGAHRSREQGVCLLELVAWWAHEPHSDTPACVSPVLREFGTQLNDTLSADRRQALKAYVPAMVGTAGDGLDERRGYLALDWLIRVHTPAWLRLAGLDAEAKALSQAVEITDPDTARAARPLAEAARSAAWSAAWSVTWSAAESVARSAARSAVESVAGSVAWSAAESALASTVQELQEAAITLFARMIHPTTAEVA